MLEHFKSAYLKGIIFVACKQNFYFAVTVNIAWEFIFSRLKSITPQIFNRNTSLQFKYLDKWLPFVEFIYLILPNMFLVKITGLVIVHPWFTS